MSNYTYADLFDKSASKKEITIETEDKSVKITNSEIHFEQFELKWEAALPPRGRENSRVRIGASAIRPLEYFPYGLASPDRRGKAGSERRKACFHPGGSGFRLPRDTYQHRPPISLKQLLRHTQVLCYFLH